MPAPLTDLEKFCDAFTKSETVMILLQVEDKLRATGHADAADKLDKLQQDVTAWYAFADTPTPKAGESTAVFVAAFDAITPSRVNNLLRDLHAALPADNLKEEFSKFMEAARLPEVAAPAASVAKPKFR